MTLQHFGSILFPWECPGTKKIYKKGRETRGPKKTTLEYQFIILFAGNQKVALRRGLLACLSGTLFRSEMSKNTPGVEVAFWDLFFNQLNQFEDQFNQQLVTIGLKNGVK